MALSAVSCLLALREIPSWVMVLPVPRDHVHTWACGYLAGGGGRIAGAVLPSSLHLFFARVRIKRFDFSDQKIDAEDYVDSMTASIGTSTCRNREFSRGD